MLLLNQLAEDTRHQSFQKIMMKSRACFIPSLRLLPHLLLAGWYPTRWSSKQIKLAQSALTERWLPSAEVFVGKFGGLIIGPNLLNTNVDQYVSSYTDDEDQLESMLGTRVCPLGFASFISEGGTIYVTSCRQYFLANSEEAIYLGKSLPRVLEVLVLYRSPPPPPQRWERVITEFNLEKSKSDMG